MLSRKISRLVRRWRCHHNWLCYGVRPELPEEFRVCTECRNHQRLDLDSLTYRWM